MTDHYKNLYEIFEFCNENDYYGDAGDPNRFQQLIKNPSKSNGIKMMKSFIFAKMSTNNWTKEFLKENDLNEETIDKYL